MIFSIPLLGVVFLSLAPYVSCQTSTSSKTLMQALAEIPECKQYYEFLLQHPEAQTPPPPGQNYVVYCPGNEAVQSKLAQPLGGKVKRNAADMIKSMAALTATGIQVTKTAKKRQATSLFTSLATSTPTSLATSVTTSLATSTSTSLATSLQPSPTTTGTTSTTATSSPGGSLVTSTPVATGVTTFGPDPFALDPNQVTLKTTFNDPAFVNLGPGEVLRMVSFSSGGPKLACGVGDAASVVTRNIPFDNGVINIAQQFANLPVSLSQSITQLGQKIFLAALTKYNLIGVASTTPRVSIFIPIDSSLSGEPSECTTKQHIVMGQLLYTPDIVLGKPYTTMAGGSITIEIKNGVYTLPGGATIVKANVITPNGVAHFIKGTVNGSCEIKTFTGGSNKISGWMGGLVGVVGIVVGLLA